MSGESIPTNLGHPVLKLFLNWKIFKTRRTVLRES
jgi:hypothetical protein